MSTIPEIKARLLETTPWSYGGYDGDGTPFVLVSGALALAALQKEDAPPQMPAAYVLAPKDAAGENLHATGPVLQRSERDIMVVIVAEDLSDPVGSATTDVLESCKAFVRGKLIGFVPSDMDEPITHIGGELVQATGGTAWHEETLSAPIYLKEAS